MKKIFFILIIGFSSLFSYAFAAYPDVVIENTTDMIVTGKVSYASVFCRDDTYVISAKSTWTASSRGACLLTSITAKDLKSGKFGESYHSSGTSYSRFIIYADKDGKPSVTRNVH